MEGASVRTLTSSFPRAIKTGKRRRFSSAFKLEVVECAEKTTNYRTAKIFGVEAHMVSKWKKHKQELIRSPSTRKRLGVYRVGPMLPEMEDNLMLWITAKRAENCQVGRNDVQTKAMELAHGCNRFMASREWLDSFLKRKEMYLCLRKTGGGRKKPLAYDEQQLAREPVEIPPAVPSNYSKNGKSKSYNTAFKLEVVECAENTTNSNAAGRFSLDISRVRLWRKQKQELKCLSSTRRRLGGGRKPVLPEMEDNLMLWITAQRAENCQVDRNDVQKKAMVLAHGCNLTFKASGPWLNGFLRRKEISLDPSKTGQDRKKSLPFLVDDEQQLAREPMEIPPAVPSHYSERESFSTAFKLEVVKCAENTTNSGAARTFSLQLPNVRLWRKQKQKLKCLPSTRKRLGGGRKPMLPEMEDNLMLWITAQRAENCQVDRNDVQKKAMELAHGCNFSFKASGQWLNGFLRRKEISLGPSKTGRGGKKSLPFLVDEQQLAREPVAVEEKNEELKEKVNEDDDEEEGSLAWIL